jgi:hypothetical protein
MRNQQGIDPLQSQWHQLISDIRPGIDKHICLVGLNQNRTSLTTVS